MEFYCSQALAESTGRTYASAKKRYFQFYTNHKFTPLPAHEHSICCFVASLAREGLTCTTIKCYLSGVRHLHVENGWGDPKFCSMARLELVLRGVKRVQSTRVKPRLPITPKLLRELRGVWLGQTNNWDGRMLWAAAALCFFGFLRSGEITVPSDTAFSDASHLTFKDVAVDKLMTPTMLKIHLKASKTDPFRMGVDVIVGSTGDPLCPVTAVLEFLRARGAKGGPLFRFQDGRPLTRTRFVERVREALQKAGIDSRHYSGHSFRIGAATTAAQEGVEDSTIKMLGRWKSSAYQLYIRTPKERLAAMSKRLVRSGPQTLAPGL